MSTLSLSADHAAKTYRYLRLGILGATGMLILSVILEVLETRCVLTSISAYYYTAARPVFVGALLAIGLALIVLKGQRKEDLALNVAGMLAPVVAVVPIRSFDRIGTCVVRDPLRNADPEVLDVFLDVSVGNNMSALLWAGIGGLTVTIVVLIKGKKKPRAIMSALRHPIGDSEQESLFDVLLFGSVFAIYGSWFLFWRDAFIDHAHLLSAGGMFGALALAAHVCAKSSEGWRSRTYRWISRVMFASAIALAVTSFFFDWWILVLEIVQIILFGTYWAIQTSERWSEKVVK